MIPKAPSCSECQDRQQADRAGYWKPDASSESEANTADHAHTGGRNLAEIWVEVLGVRRVGVTDNFFELAAIR
jgi:hypothetical protein